MRRRHHDSSGGSSDERSAVWDGARTVATLSFAAAAALWCLGGGPQRAGIPKRLSLLQPSLPAALRQVPPRRASLHALAADRPSLRRRSVAAISSEGKGFVDLIVPEGARIVRADGRTGALPDVRPGQKLVCRGEWADDAHTTFRVAQVSLGPVVPSRVLSDRVAAACALVTERRERESAAVTVRAARRTAARNAGRPAPRVGADLSEVFVAEGLSLERDEPARAAAPGVEPGYRATGTLRNVSGSAYAAVEVQASVFDNRGRKVADQTVRLENVRPGDRARFFAGPPAALPFREGHSVRVDGIVLARP